jgi:EAL domain-containing protein (putative c-di-GMP-specific phosphodiesterase class I)
MDASLKWCFSTPPLWHTKAVRGRPSKPTSLAHLKRFPVDVIKIDRSFVSKLETHAGDAAIVRAVLSLAQSLGIKVVAEGVETAEQVALLREQGCNLVQGYHVSRPMPARDVPKFITAREQM